MPRFVDALAGAIAAMLDRPRAAADRAELAASLAPHTWSAVFDRYEAVYDELLVPA